MASAALGIIDFSTAEGALERSEPPADRLHSRPPRSRCAQPVQ